MQNDCDVVAELEGFTVLATAGGYIGRDDFLEFVDGAVLPVDQQANSQPDLFVGCDRKTAFTKGNAPSQLVTS